VYENGGYFEFQIIQKALEFSSSAKTTTASLTVNLQPAELEPELEEQTGFLDSAN